MAKSKHKSAGYNPGHGVSKKANVPATNTQLATAVQYQCDGRLAEAQAIYSRMLAANPRDFVVMNNLGLIAFDQGRESDAEVLFKQAASLNNRYVMPLMNLGNLFQSRKNYPEAIFYYEQALQVDSSYSPTHVNLGNLLTAQGKFEEAVASYHRALAISPDLAEAYLNLGNALVQLGRSADAVPQYERARSLQPGNAGAHIYLGVALLDLGQLDRAKAFLQQGLQLAPDNVDAWINLGTVFTALGLTNESVQCFRRALELSPDHPGALSNLLSCLNYCDSLSPADVAQESRRVGEAMERRFMTAHQHHTNKADSGRRLRIGYVSPDFRRHAVAFFLEPLFRHDRSAVEIFCYAEVANPDQITQRFQLTADHWFSTVGVTDDALAARIQEDGIDILVDLAGHTNHNRVPVFARRPAPVQMTWLGYPNTTGLRSIDYRLVDSITDMPDVADQLASETLIRLDGCFICYNPPGWAPAPMPPPSVTNGFVTFGSFNNLAKLSDASLRLWGSLLMRMPSSRLLLKSRYFIAEDSKAYILARLQKHGVAPERVMLLGPSPDADQLAAYHQVDIALDSFPYNGTTTTCEALWMGVPVVTLAGESHCSRVGASLLTHTGLSDLIARDQDDYVRIAAELADDPTRLARLRQELRGRVAASPLCDASAFVRKLEAVYRTVWDRWCGVETLTPEVKTTPVDALPVRLSNGIVLAVPPSLDAITTYVALEQEAWFEKEADFPSLWLKPGMTAIEIGANLGIYSLPMARAVAPSGHVFAYEPGSAAADLLEHSRDLNNAANLTVVRAALSDRSRIGHLLIGSSSELNKLNETGLGERVSITCLDDEDRLRNWNAPDFVKIDAEGEEERILRGGIDFFTRHSPLVMFEVDNGAKAHLSTCKVLCALDYHLYRLLPGAPVLVPDSGNDLDAYELNLFAAKPDRAAALARDGWLVEALPDWRPSEVGRQTALQPLRQVSNAAAFADLLADSRPLDPSYRDCLAGFAAWRSPDLALPARCAAMEFALAGLLALNTQATSYARLLTFARVAWEAGKRALSVQALRHFLTQAKPGMLRLEEPFWPPHARFDGSMPTGGLENWIIGSVTEQIERGGHHSSYYTGLTAGLEWLSAHPFESVEMQRRRVLVRARAGQRTEVPQRLRIASADHLNAALWQAACVPNTSVPQPSAQAAIPVAPEKQAIPPRRFINVALNRPASQSSTSEWSKTNDPERAVSGTCTGTFTFCTAVETEPFWSVDLQSSFVIRRIAIYNCEDSNPDWACPLTVETSLDGREWREIVVVKYVFGGAVTGVPLNLVFREPIQARYVRLRRTGEPRPFHLDQVEIYTSVDDIQSCARIREDLWVLRMMGGRSGGSFVEIGSSDGVTANNTYLLEARFGWRGVCVEPNPAFYQKLAQNRTARTFQRAVFRNSGDTLKFVPFGDIGTLVGFEASDKFATIRKVFMEHQTIQVETISPDDLFAQGELPSLIDFLSLDTEGSEWDILESIDFSRYNFALMAIEHNHVADKREMIYKKLKQLGYNRFDAGSDDWYYHPVHLDTLNKNIRVDFKAVLDDFRMQDGFGKEPA